MLLHVALIYYSRVASFCPSLMFLGELTTSMSNKTLEGGGQEIWWKVLMLDCDHRDTL